MKRVKKVLRWLLNFVLTLVSVPAYIAIVPPLVVILLCELLKLNGTVLRTMLDELKKKEVK